MKKTRLLLLAGAVVPAFVLSAPVVADMARPNAEAPIVLAQKADDGDAGGDRKQQREQRQQEREQRTQDREQRTQDRQEKMQERQDRQERRDQRPDRGDAAQPKPERQERPDRPDRQERPDRQQDRGDAAPDRQRPDRPDRQERPDRQQRPDTPAAGQNVTPDRPKADSPDRPKADRPDRAGDDAKPSRPDGGSLRDKMDRERGGADKGGRTNDAPPADRDRPGADGGSLRDKVDRDRGGADKGGRNNDSPPADRDRPGADGGSLRDRMDRDRGGADKGGRNNDAPPADRDRPGDTRDGRTNEPPAADRDRGNDQRANDRRDDRIERLRDKNRDLQDRIRENRQDDRNRDRDRGGLDVNIRLDALRDQRRERRDGDRVIITEPGGRTIIRDGNRTIIRRDEGARFRIDARDVREERRNGEIRTVVTRPDGTRVITVTDEDGRLIRRIREDRGQEYVLIDNTPRGGRGRDGYFVDLDIAPPRISIPRERYIVDADRASERDIYDAFDAEPVERPQRSYSLDEIRQSQPLRQYVRSVDLDAVTFDTGSWEVRDDQISKLENVGKAMEQAIKKNPRTVFMVEGHTDAVGSDEDNLSLSDRRAEAVAEVITKYFEVPAENLTTQGYGEQYLKEQTDGPSERNRRVTVRNITSLLSTQNAR